MRPPSPSRAILSPAENRRSLNSSARLSRSRSSRSEKSGTLRRSAAVGLAMGQIHTRTEQPVSRGGVARDELLDLQLGALQARDAFLVELLAATEERDRVVDRHVAALEARHDVVELALQLLERPLGHARTSSTRAPSDPDASWTSRASPRATSALERRASPPTR